MAKTREQKEQILKDINQRIRESNSLVFCVFDKLSVNDDQELRSELRKNNIPYKVIKKTLLKRSFQENKINNLPEKQLVGNISLASCQDEVMGAKILAKFAQDKENFKIIGGLLNKVWFGAEKIAELAELPTKDELIIKTINTIKAPLNGLVNVLIGNIRGVVNVLNAIKNNK